jgi:3-methyladenine DNA glycosylase AlkD
MNGIVSGIRKALKETSDEKTRESGRKFFKEPVKLYGVKTAAVRAIGKQYFKAVKDKTKAEVFGLCEELWRSGCLEESFIACEWSYNLRRAYAPGDFTVFERWVSEYVGNWASCDTLCNHTVGAFVEMHPGFVAALKRWAASENRWVRRASAVSLIIPARRGKFLEDVIGIADILLSDEDDLVQKGYGWMLKAASQAHRKEIFEYVMKNRAAMPRTALRYAIEKMPKGLKARAMKR